MFKAVWMFYFFSPYVYCYKFYVLARLIIWIFIILTDALWKIPPPEILCCVFKCYWLSDEGITHWFNYILINEN